VEESTAVFLCVFRKKEIRKSRFVSSDLHNLFMVKVAVLGSTGKSGSRIVTELLNRGHSVVAIARDPSKVENTNANLTVVQGSTEGDLAGYIAGSDIVVNAYAPPFGSENELIGVTSRLVDAVKAAGVSRLIMVGGAGGLKVPDGTLVINQSWFNADWVPIAQAHIDALQVLRSSDVNWTTLSPPGNDYSHFMCIDFYISRLFHSWRENWEIPRGE
jgi:uncharacterized protein